MDKRFIAQQFNRFMQMQMQSANLDDDKAMEVADLYPAWDSKKSYEIGEIFKQRQRNTALQGYSSTHKSSGLDTRCNTLTL